MPKFPFILSAAQPGRRVPLSVGLLCGSVLLLSCFAAIHGERDFNLNESQVPVLEPKDETHHIKYTLPEDPYAIEMSRCDSADSEILLSLVLKQHDWHDFNDSRRVKVLNKLSKFFAIPKEFIVMETVKKYDLREMQKAAVRKGENKCHSSKRLLGRVNFMIGCGSSYFKAGEPIANQIGAQMRDGTIDHLTGEKFGWWIIWHKDSNVRSQRLRRQAVEGSGDDYEYDDDYDYGDDAEAEVTTETHTHRHHHGASDTEQSIARPTDEEAEEESTDNNDNSINTISDTDETLKSPPQPPPASSLGPSSALNGNTEFTDSPAVVDEDEEVSQLESVITKTIENTKNLKELAGLEGEVMPPHVEVPTVAEIEKELDLEFSNELAAHGSGNDATTAPAAVAVPASSSTMGNFVMPPATDEEQMRTVTQPLGPRGGEEAVDFAAGTPIKVDDDEEDDDDVYDEDEKVEDNEAIGEPLGGSAPDVGSERLPSGQQAADGIDAQPIGTNTNVGVDGDASDEGGVIDASAAAATIHAFTTTASAAAAYATTTTPSASTTPASTTSTISASSSSTVHQYGGGEFHLHHTHTDTPPSSAADTSSSTFVLTPTQTSEHHHNHHQHGHQQTEHHQHHHQQHNHEQSIATPLPPTQSESHSPPAHQPHPSSPSSSSSTSNDSDTESLSSLSSPSSSFSVSSTISLLGSTTTSTTTTPPPPPYDSSATISTMQTGEGHQSKDASTVQPANSVNQDADAKATPLANESESSSTAASPAAVEASSLDTPEPIGTDEAESNSAPMIKTRLQKLAITSGKSFRFTVPAETFYDNEDDTNLRLLLTEKDGRELKPTSWLQFDGETRELYGLPLDDTVSKYQYLLSATDSGNESVTETVEISVQQHHSIRSVNHEVSVAVKINDKQMLNIDWQLKLIKAIADTLGDSGTDSIVVREVRQNPQEPGAAIFVYFNETLPTSSCPETELNRLVKDLDAQRLSELVSPWLGIKSISGQLIGACQKSHTTKPKLATPAKNIAPIPVNQVDRVNAVVGHLLVYKVPGDTFYDANDDPLKLSLKTKDNEDISPEHWLQFDSKNKEFYGIPKSQDSGREEEFILVAEDSGGLSATDALVVVVKAPPRRDYAVFFKAYLAIRPEQFDSLLQRKFVERIAELNGDQTTEFVQIRSISPDHDSDGLVVTFYNTTLFKSQNRCPDEQIDAMRHVYLMQDNILRERVKKVIGSELSLTNLKVLTGTCDLKMDTGHRDNTPIPTENEPTLKSSFQDYMYTVILPALIIITMILIASIIACCLHRRRRKSGKMELGDEEERKAFRKGIPVIFQDELDEKPEIGNKSPIILKDEKPPLLPPSYNTSNMNGDTDVDEYVPPPAVVMGGREARGKSPATPSYRKPPPYVSP